MAETTESLVRRTWRWIRRLLVLVFVLVVVAVGALEYAARRTNVETSASGTSVIEPRGFFSRSNLVQFLRVEQTQWVDADNRKECFTRGEGCTLTGNDVDRDGVVDQIYVSLTDEAILPHLRGHDRELGGLRLFVTRDPDGVPRVDQESLDELQRVVQALFDDGMERYAGVFEDGAGQ